MKRLAICVALLAGAALSMHAQTTGGMSLPSASSISNLSPAFQAASAAAGGNEGTTVVGAAFGDALDNPGVRAAQAMVTPEYPVTPGDVYTLTFITSSGIVTSSVIVGIGNSIDLANLGKMEAAGKLFADIKRRIEAKVLEAYPLSAPQLIIQSCGQFPVYVQGEVKQTSMVYCWGLSRLSTLWAGTTPYASNREIAIKASSGPESRYDLFKAWRYGDLSQNPYLEPWDTVVFKPYERQVSIAGEVKRPGTYQLLSGETLKDLVETYADGLTVKANPGRTAITRYQAGSAGVGSSTLLDYAASPRFQLATLDAVTVPSAQDLLPVVYFEGALGVGINGEDPQAAARIPYTFFPGETLAQAVQKLRAKFSAVSDLPDAYLVRNGEKRPVNFEGLLYGKDYALDFPLEKNDVFIVPFRQFFISVAGAVNIPGRYPYVPDRNWTYYVGLAGGLDKDKNAGEALSIFDVQGRSHGKDRMIQPEDSIVAVSNNFIYQFGKVSAIISMIVSVVAVVVTLTK